MYKALYGKVSSSSNDTILLFGIIACISLPLVGLFDEKEFGTMHGITAVAFFASAMFYEIWVTSELKNHKDKFPGYEDAIEKLGYSRYMAFASILTMGVGALFEHRLIAVGEWLTVLYFVDFYALVAIN